ncbi:MAG: hypothetical protein AB7D51_10130 [Desulfovibrionaceae bacterium]
MKSAEREKFVRLANKRVNAALKAIQEVGKLANRAVYEYGPEDVEKIFQSLGKEAEDCRKQFEIAMNVDSWVQFSLED